MRIPVIVCALLAAAGASAGVIENADQPSLRIGADGRAVVAYRYRAPGSASSQLRVSRCVDAACSSVTTATLDASADVGYRPSLAIGAGGRPVVSYLDLTNGDLKVAFCADAACSAASAVVLDPDVGISSQPEGGRTAIAVGADGFLLVAYTDQEPGVPPPPHGVNDRLKIVHCEDAACATRTTTNVLDAVGYLPVVMGIDGDARAFVLWHRSLGISTFFDSVRCNDLACTSLDFLTGARQRAPILPSAFSGLPSLAFQANGFPAYLYTVSAPFQVGGLTYARCADAGCDTASTTEMPGLGGVTSLSLPGGGALPRFAAVVPEEDRPYLSLQRCQDVACTTRSVSCIAPQGSEPSLATDPVGHDVVAFERGMNVELLRFDPLAPPPACTIQGWIDDAAGTERGPGQAAVASFRVTVTASAATVTVAYHTVDDTAHAGSDYVAQTGVLTFAPGQTLATIVVPLVSDHVQEPTETFRVQLSSPTIVSLVDDLAVGVITDDDVPPLPTIDLAGCTVPEGDASTTACSFNATLSQPSTLAVTVQFATQDGSATGGTDYLPASGTMTFPPGIVSSVLVSGSIGDTDVELDETFTLTLSNPVNAQAGTMSAVGVVVDDDATPLSTIEVGHGTRLVTDLTGAPDAYRLAQAPYTSWEAVIDEVSGDAAPGLVLERLGEDNSTVLQTAVPAGTGSARALRWQHRGSTTEIRQHLRVRSADCGTACGADDTYRLRVYETTGRIARFNTVSPQVTVVLLQNMGDTVAGATVDFWSVPGTRVYSHPVALAPLQLLVLSTATLPALAGHSGTVTVTHEAPYGALVGKSVALDPANGFSFDTPLEPRPR